MLTLRYFPKSWKTAVVVPILKPGKNSALAEFYRPISLLPVLSKLAEKVILARLNDYLERENILIPEQHGFRPRLSTSHQLLRVVEFIKETTKTNARPRSSLIFKKLLIDVKINRTYSQLKKISAGVAQGSILAPILFNLYVNDIIKNTNTQLCLYADDTAILSRHRNLNTLVENINEHLAHLEIWFSVWKIALNSTKTEAVFFSKRQPPEITLQNQRIPWSQHTKYLGVIIDKNLTFRQHITYIRDKFKDTTRKLYSLICRKSKLSRHNKLLIYTLILKPLLTYASPVWGHAAKTNINLLETSQNVIIRQICNAHWYMRNKDIRIACNVPTLRKTFRKLAINFFKNIDDSDNASINSITPYFSHFSVKRPRDILVNPDFD
ncbi:RNA-directed DNA polymerase from mobile element jockey [Trichonephila clavipes]|nr:RNA-directed DNA polymerase from mobile element jockey [Trichonephila clavipes]